MCLFYAPGRLVSSYKYRQVGVDRSPRSSRARGPPPASAPLNARHCPASMTIAVLPDNSGDNSEDFHMNMNSERLLATFLELCAIPSPSRSEAKVAAFVRVALEDLGIDVHEDDAAIATGGDSGNLIATIPGHGAPLLLAAHMDTVPVPDPVAPVVDGEIVRSAGDTILGADDKSAVAVMIELARVLKKQEKQETQEKQGKGTRPHRPLEMVFTVGEETELAGAKALDYSRLSARTGYALDGSDPGRVVRGAPSKFTWDVVVHGRGGHGTKPEDTINPILVAADALRRMPLGQIDEQSTANAGVLHAGTAVNVVPESARMLIEVRSHDEDRLNTHAANIEHAIAQACAAAQLQTPDGTVTASADAPRSRCYDAFHIEEDDETVQAAFAAIRAAGLQPRSTVGRGAQDTNVFNKMGISCVTLGTGAHSPHTNREYLVIPEMIASVAVILNLVTVPS